MHSPVQKHPWLILAAGAAVQILTGVPAAWGVFQQPVMAEYGFSEAAASYAFSILIASFGLGCVLGGFLQDRFGPRPAALLGTALLVGGFGAAGFLPAGQPWLFFAAFSVPAGLGSAFLYPAVFSCAQKWYKDRKGLATGVIGGAVGLSGAFLTWLVRSVVRGGWGPFTGIRGAFWALAALLLPVCTASSLLLADPPAGKGEGMATKGQTPAAGARAGLSCAAQPAAGPRQAGAEAPGKAAAGQPTARKKRAAGLQPTSAQAAAKPPAPPAGPDAAPDFTPRRMLRTPAYWRLFAAVALSTPAVLLFSPILVRLGMERGLSETGAHAVILIGSAGSAAGRLLMPLLSDKIGRRRTDLWLFAALAGLSVALWQAQGWWMAAVYAGLTFCYSGMAAVLPSFSSDLFGLPHAGVDYGFLALGQSAGSLIFPPAAAALGLAGGRHGIAAAAALAGFFVLWGLRPPKSPKSIA